MYFLGDVVEFKRGKDKKPRKRRRRSERAINASRRDKAYSTNPYYGTKADRNIRRAELSTRSIRNTASGVRALSNISGEVRSWTRLATDLKELNKLRSLVGGG